jgi:hypothetical protein
MNRELLSPTVRALLDPDRLPALGPGAPDPSMRGRLAALTPAGLFEPGKFERPDFARACLSALWLLYDFLDESHAISQEIATPEGSYWHAIMHRREPDAANAKYWFRRVGEHPVFETLGTEAQRLGLHLPNGRWDPFAFIERCEAHRGTGTELEVLLRKVQQREWDLLFHWCFDQAIGKE